MGTQIYALWDIFATRKKKVQDVKQYRPCGGVDLDRCLMEYIVPKAATQFEIVKLGIIVPFQIKKLSVQVESFVLTRHKYQKLNVRRATKGKWNYRWNFGGTFS